jgi:4-amino-4-deoxychorismate lyase
MALGSNARLAGIKHLNRLEQVLARAEWRDPAIAEGLMRDHEGWVVCATASNLFLLEADGLVTPPLDRCGVAGTVRACVFEQAAAAGVAVRERRVAVDDLLRARAAFLTNSLAGVRPIGWCEDRGFDPEALPWGLLATVQREALRPESDW